MPENAYINYRPIYRRIFAKFEGMLVGDNVPTRGRVVLPERPEYLRSDQASMTIYPTVSNILGEAIRGNIDPLHYQFKSNTEFARSLVRLVNTLPGISHEQKISFFANSLEYRQTLPLEEKMYFGVVPVWDGKNGNLGGLESGKIITVTPEVAVRLFEDLGPDHNIIKEMLLSEAGIRRESLEGEILSLSIDRERMNALKEMGENPFENRAELFNRHSLSEQMNVVIAISRYFKVSLGPQMQMWEYLDSLDLQERIRLEWVGQYTFGCLQMANLAKHYALKGENKEILGLDKLDMRLSHTYHFRRNLIELNLISSLSRPNISLFSPFKA